MKLGMKEQALDCLNLAFSHVSSENKTVDNGLYFNILTDLSALSIEKLDKERAKALIEEGLSVKKDHTDLLFLNILLLMDENRYDEVIEAIINYLLSSANGDIDLYNYRYTHDGVLKEIYENLLEIIKTNKPDSVAIEEIFFAKNVKTAISVGHARGVLMLAAINEGIEVAEYTPLQVKIAVVGYGRAEKYQVQEMLKIIFKLKSVPKPDDAADALAIAYCHISSLGIRQRMKS